MLCENIFCIYWTENGCCLDEITLDIQGCCENSVYVEIEEDALEAKRKHLCKREGIIRPTKTGTL